MEERGNVIMDLLKLAGEELSEVQEFDKDIFVISDGRFIKTLTGNEFLVYYSFLGVLSRHNNNGQHYFYKSDLNFSELEQELRLRGRYQNTIMTRKTIKTSFDQLVKKKVFKLTKLDNGDEVYYITPTRNYMFTRMTKQTYKGFSKTLSGDALKIFCFIKGNLDNVKLKGEKVLYLNRHTIAENCGITNNKGEINERQLRTVGTIISTLGDNFGLIDYKIRTKIIDGEIKSIYEIQNIRTHCKK